MPYGTVKGVHVHQVGREDVGYSWQTTDPGPAVVTPTGTRITVSHALWQAIEHVIDCARDGMDVQVNPVPHPIPVGFSSVEARSVLELSDSDLNLAPLEDDLSAVRLHASADVVEASRQGRTNCTISFIEELEDALRG